MVTWELSKPPVDCITGLSPSISIDQHLTNHSPRSTVGTATEVYTYLRVLVRPPRAPPLPELRARAVAAQLSNLPAEGLAGRSRLNSPDEARFPCPHCGAAVPELGMAHFSFNKPAGACPTCTGLGVVRQVNRRAA